MTAARRVLAAALLASAPLAVAGCRAPRAAEGVEEAGYEVSAVRYGTLADFPVRGLVAGADSGRRMDIALMVWVLRNPARTVLVDAGFYRDKFIRQWRPRDFVRPSEALARAGVRPDEVTDVVLSHVHWDHMDGVDLFPRARVWIQRAEYEYYVSADGKPLHSGIDSEDAALLANLRGAGRVQLVDGDAKEIFPGVTVYTGGRHTWASQYVGVRTPEGTAVIASDNAYLYENLERRRPIAQTFDSVANLAAQARMLGLASAPRLVVPGHDPAVFERFPTPGGGVARIR